MCVWELLRCAQLIGYVNLAANLQWWELNAKGKSEKEGRIGTRSHARIHSPHLIHAPTPFWFRCHSLSCVLPKNVSRSKWVVGWMWMVEWWVLLGTRSRLLTLQCPRGPFEAFVVRFFLKFTYIYNHVFRDTRELWLWPHFVVFCWQFHLLGCQNRQNDWFRVWNMDRIHSCINKALYMHDIRLWPLDTFIWTLIWNAALTFPPSLSRIFCKTCIN